MNYQFVVGEAGEDRRNEQADVPADAITVGSFYHARSPFLLSVDPIQADYEGGPGNDVYTGTSGDDTINGNDGDDTLAGGAGGDTINGGNGDDHLYSATISPDWSSGPYPPFSPPLLDTGAEVDTLNGGAGVDFIYAGYGDNVDGGQDGAYLLISFQGATSGVTVDFSPLRNHGSVVVGGGTIVNAAEQWVDGSNYGDTITAGTTILIGTTVRGLGGDDTLIAGYYGATLYGGDGNDTLDFRNTQYGGTGYGEAGNDIIYTRYLDYYSGGDGNDIFYGAGSIHGDAGNDTVNIVFGSYSSFRASYGGADDDILNGSIGDDTMLGNGGSDTLHGGNGADRLFSGGIDTGNDQWFISHANYGSLLDELDDGTEVDHVFGEGGDDRLSVGYGDEADGGSGTNALLLSLGGATAGVTLDVASILAGPISLGGQTLSNFQSVEGVWGSAFGDTITTGTQQSAIAVHGRDGNDVLTASGSAVTFYGDAGDDQITGSAFADTIYGGTGADTIRAGGGDDRIIVTALTDLAPGETIDGGTGYDTLTLAFGGTVDISTVAASIERLDHVGSDYAFPDVKLTTSQLAQLSYIAVNSITLTTGGTALLAGVTWASGNTITLSNAGNTLDLTGLIGTFFDGAVVNGGAGDDIITMLPGNSWDTVYGGGGNDTIYAGDGADKVYGGDGNDTLYGGAYDDTLYGGLGVDAFHGDDGNDLIDVTGSDFAAGEIYDGGAGNDTLRFAPSTAIDISTSTITSIETLTVNGGTLSLTGGQLASFTTLGGNSAQFTLTTGGSVSLNGKTISGTFNLAPADTVFDLTGAILSQFSVTVNGNSGNDTLTGTASGDTLNGGGGNDRIDGAAGSDQMTGGLGDDTYILDSSGDRVFESANGGNDTIESSVTVTTLNSTNVETIKLTGTGNINATGTSSIANTLIGNSGNNRLDGGGGGDRMEGGAGDDAYVVRSASDVVVEGLSAGTDTVLVASNVASYALATDVQVEKLTALTPSLTTAMDLTGNAFSHDIQGNAGANFLTGGTGADTIQGFAGNDYLVGGGGADTLIGGLGDDFYVVSDAATLVTEVSGEGYDTVKSSVSYVLGAGVEVETARLLGSANLGLTGNAFAQVLIGNDGNNSLDGGGGGDRMKGRDGNDTYMIRSMADTIAEFVGKGDDTVKAAVSYVLESDADIEHLQTLDSTATTAINLTGNAYSHDIQGNAGANVLTAGSGDDVLRGFAGNDTLFGGSGADRFVFDHGTGQDTVGDFVSGSDKLDLSAFGFANFAAVQAATQDVGGNAVIDLGGGDSVTLSGVLSAQLQSGDVILSGSQAPLKIGIAGGQGWVVVQDDSYAPNLAVAHHFLDHDTWGALPAYEYF